MAEEFKISPDNYDQPGESMSNYINDGINAGKTMKVVVSEWKESRSLSQNALMWKWYGEISKQTKQKIGQDHDAETYHEHFKKKYCPVTKVKLGNVDIEIKSTKKLDTGGVHFYLQQIDMWAANAGYTLTIPISSEYQQLIDRQVR